jgi:N-acetyl-anhydromuramyl-L-alanine amidase AmpD
MCIGNFSEQDVPNRQLRSLINVLAWACAKFDVRPRTIHGHRDYASTACPGMNLQRRINNGSIRRRVRQKLNPGIDLDRLCGRAGRSRVRAIEEGRD